MHSHAETATDIRGSLRSILPDGAFRLLRTCWRYSVFGAQDVKSWVIHRRPTVRSFGNGKYKSSLAGKLERVNMASPTRFCWVMNEYGSDKANLHNYTRVYSTLFRQYRNRPVRIFELGLGTNNPRLPSNMGIYGKPGASLRGWRDLFPGALIYGADIDTSILFQDDHIKTFYCDQLDPAAIRKLWQQPDFQDGLDIIIEDGLHTFDANISFLEESIQMLRSGGLYVIEDIEDGLMRPWSDRIQTVYTTKYPEFEFILMGLPGAQSPDNNILIAHRLV